LVQERSQLEQRTAGLIADVPAGRREPPAAAAGLSTGCGCGLNGAAGCAALSREAQGVAALGGIDPEIRLLEGRGFSRGGIRGIRGYFRIESPTPATQLA